MEAKIVPYLFLNNISSEMNPFYYFRYLVTCFKVELENVPRSKKPSTSQRDSNHKSFRREVDHGTI